MLYRKICTRMLDYDAFLFHAAIVSYAGRGFAFAAKSGTGKSTHVAQWMRALGGDVTVVNGDKPILRWRTGGSCRASRWDAQRGRRMCLYLFRCAS